MLPWCMCLTQTPEMNVGCQERSKIGIRFAVAYMEPHQFLFKGKTALSPRYPQNPPREGGYYLGYSISPDLKSVVLNQIYQAKYMCGQFRWFVKLSLGLILRQFIFKN